MLHIPTHIAYLTYILGEWKGCATKTWGLLASVWVHIGL